MLYLTNVLQNLRKRISAKLLDGGTRYGGHRPVIIAFGVPLIATETFLCLSESFLCHLQHTKSPHKISERK